MLCLWLHLNLLLINDNVRIILNYKLFAQYASVPAWNPLSVTFIGNVVALVIIKISIGIYLVNAVLTYAFHFLLFCLLCNRCNLNPIVACEVLLHITFSLSFGFLILTERYLHVERHFFNIFKGCPVQETRTSIQAFNCMVYRSSNS